MKTTTLLLVLLAAALDAAAQEPARRAGRSEWSLSPYVVGSNSYDFDGGATARNDGGAGIALAYARNLNDYFAVGMEVALASFDYRATIAPAAGNANPPVDSIGTMDLGSLRITGTWNLLARSVTPFITGNLGVTYVDTNIASGPPVSACWVYPYWGTICGAAVPTHTMTRFSYGAGIGLRVDLPREQGFVRGQVAGEWIDFSGGRVGYPTFRADFGLKF